MTKTSWQVPAGGLEDTTKEYFWSKVDRSVEGHWLWKGSCSDNTPWLYVKGAYVYANRIAWSLKYPAKLIPDRLFRQVSCEHKKCINPDCFRGKEIKLLAYAEAAPAPQVGDDVEVISLDSSFHVPRIIEAMGAIQFGLPVRPRVIRRLQVEGAPDVETIQTPTGPLAVTKPVGAEPYLPRQDDIQRAPRMTAQQILDLIFQPNTMVVTFPSGRVWISTPDARVDADDGQSALLGILTRAGKHRVAG